jgi:two-component system OmpR family sensor kinase
MLSLTVIFSAILYTYIIYTVDQTIEKSLKRHTDYILATYKNIPQDIDKDHDLLKQTLNIDVKLIQVVGNIKKHRKRINKYSENDRYFFELLVPYNTDTSHYISISADVTKQKQMQKAIYKSIIIINIMSIFLVGVYAFIISKMLIAPIEVLNQKLSNMNEHMIKAIDVSNLPIEFTRLGESINGLLKRIQNFLMYKKELFVGTAHELKTPLAVMKTKNQVTLFKKNINEEQLRDAIKQNITSIDELNKIISSILEFGRAEGAQFESPQELDIIKFLEQKCSDFDFLASSKEKKFAFNLSPTRYPVKIQTLLLTQILQNFVQNALRFSPDDKVVTLQSYAKGNQFIIEVVDQGVGIDENKDLFAPFIRGDKSKGTGLGLFLAKSAADALGAQVELKNRVDTEGAVARLILTNYQSES